MQKFTVKYDSFFVVWNFTILAEPLAKFVNITRESFLGLTVSWNVNKMAELTLVHCLSFCRVLLFFYSGWKESTSGQWTVHDLCLSEDCVLKTQMCSDMLTDISFLSISFHHNLFFVWLPWTWAVPIASTVLVLCVLWKHLLRTWTTFMQIWCPSCSQQPNCLVLNPWQRPWRIDYFFLSRVHGCSWGNSSVTRLFCDYIHI